MMDPLSETRFFRPRKGLLFAERLYILMLLTVGERRPSFASDSIESASSDKWSPLEDAGGESHSLA